MVDLAGQRAPDDCMIEYGLRLLGGFCLDHKGQSVSLPNSSHRLIALLGMRGWMPRSAIAGLLWPDASESRAHANLRTTLWRVSRASASLIRAHGSELHLAASVDVDVRRLWVGATVVIDQRATRLDRRELLAGELLPGWYDDWVLFERERLRQLRLHALERLAVAHRDHGRYCQAIDCALHAIHLEPLRESGHRALISIHLAEGNLSEAVRHFESYRRLLEEELGVQPSTQIRALLPSTMVRRDGGLTAS